MKVTAVTPTPRAEISFSFYESLGFTRGGKPGREYFTDGRTIIEINEDSYSRAGFRLYVESMGATLQRLRAVATVHQSPSGPICVSPSGVWLYISRLSDWESIFRRRSPKGINSEPKNSLLGNYRGANIEASDMGSAHKFWRAAGFVAVEGSVADGMVTYRAQDDFELTTMGLFTCPHLFFTPSLSFFNGEKNREIIKGLRDKGFEFTQEITVFNEKGEVDNVLLRDPGGYGFFIFND